MPISSIENQMPQFIRLSMQITLIFHIFADMQCNPFDHINTGIFQRLDFSGLLVNNLTSRICR